MTITATTLSTAVTLNAITVTVASATGIAVPNFQTGAGITYLYIDQEIMMVTNVVGTVISVVRGFNGTIAQTHVSGSQVQIGLTSDFAQQNEVLPASTTVTQTMAGVIQPAIFLTGSADAISAVLPGFYEIKTAGVDAMTLAAPAAAAEGNIIEIISDTTNAHTLTATTLLANGTALKTTATFPAFRGAYLKLRASNGIWQVLSNGASAGVVVLT